MTLIFISGFGIGCLFSVAWLWIFIRKASVETKESTKKLNEITIQLMKERNETADRMLSAFVSMIDCKETLNSFRMYDTKREEVYKEHLGKKLSDKEST